VASAAIGNINSAVEWICDSENNKDKFYETIHLLETDLIKPMQKENEDKTNVGTQTKKEDNVYVFFLFNIFNFVYSSNDLHLFYSGQLNSSLDIHQVMNLNR